MVRFIDKDTRVVTVPQNQIAEVPAMPFIPVKMIVIRGFLFFPHIKCLVHDYKTHTVAKIKKFRCRGIM